MSNTELDWGRRFCDVVMKGGITSGVVYPSAIAELAAKYELRNIGGASAGAIASAGAAAAEYRRQTETIPAQKSAGFDRLRGLADELGQPGQQSGPHSRLFHLFLPSKQAQPIFSILTRILNLKSVISRLILPNTRPRHPGRGVPAPRFPDELPQHALVDPGVQ